MQPPTDDIAIIQMVLQGRQQAYTVLVDRYKSFVFTMVFRYIKDKMIAEELAQDVFVKAYRCLADFKGNSKFSTWLYTIVNTTCLSYLRKQQPLTIATDEGQMTDIAGSLPSDYMADNRLERNTRQALLAGAMNALPPEDATILTLFYTAEQSVEEIGNILGIASANVKVKLYRARQKLRTVLETKFKNEII